MRNRLSITKPLSFERALACLVVLSLQIGSISCDARQNRSSDWGPISSGLQYKLATRRSSYVLDETIVVEIHLKNNTHSEVVISAWPTTETTFFVHTNKDGKTSSREDKVLFDPPSSPEKSFITLQPMSEFVYLTWEYGSEYFNEAGRWELNCVSLFEYNGKEFSLAAWTGSLNSNVLELDVLPRITGTQH